MASTKKNASRRAPTPAPVPVDEVFEMAGLEAAYQKALPVALALDAAGIVPYRSDAVLAYANVAVALEQLAPLKDRIEKELPSGTWKAIEGAPELALAAIYAAQVVDQHDDAQVPLGPLMAEAWGLRQLLLSTADTLALAKIFRAAEVLKIRKGTGPIDAARDCVALGALFRKHADEIRGKTVVTSAQVKRTAELGELLLKRLRPGAAKGKGASQERKDVMDVRDRIWTLVVQRHDLMERVGAWLHGLVENPVPALQARVIRKKSKKEEEPE